MQLVPLMGETQERWSPLSPVCVRTQQEGGCLQTRRRALTRIWLCWHPNLGLPAPRTLRNKCLLFKPSGLWYFIKAARTKTETKCMIMTLMQSAGGKRPKGEQTSPSRKSSRANTCAAWWWHLGSNQCTVWWIMQEVTNVEWGSPRERRKKGLRGKK